MWSSQWGVGPRYADWNGHEIWKEFGWINIIQKRHQGSGECWRRCGTSKAKNFHNNTAIIITKQKYMNTLIIYLELNKTMYLCGVPTSDCNVGDERLLNMFLVESNKATTKKSGGKWNPLPSES